MRRVLRIVQTTCSPPATGTFTGRQRGLGDDGAGSVAARDRRNVVGHRRRRAAGEAHRVRPCRDRQRRGALAVARAGLHAAAVDRQVEAALVRRGRRRGAQLERAVTRRRLEDAGRDDVDRPLSRVAVLVGDDHVRVMHAGVPVGVSQQLVGVWRGNGAGDGIASVAVAERVGERPGGVGRVDLERRRQRDVAVRRVRRERDLGRHVRDRHRARAPPDVVGLDDLAAVVAEAHGDRDLGLAVREPGRVERRAVDAVRRPVRALAVAGDADPDVEDRLREVRGGLETRRPGGATACRPGGA